MAEFGKQFLFFEGCALIARKQKEETYENASEAEKRIYTNFEYQVY